ncbi:MAG: transcriptional repressor [Alphaproteobacteria bacterium]|nr:MAG: transcriptional repressor [Alphaproteobacteria bacterium]
MDNECWEAVGTEVQPGDAASDRLDFDPSASAERVVAWLASGGLRPTRQRRLLATLLIGDGRDRHVTAESLHEAAQRVAGKVSLATVYNTLRAFTAAGLLTEVMVHGARSHFDTRTDDHPHFYFEDEGRLVDAPPLEMAFARLPETPRGTEIAKIDVVIRLRRCRDAEQGA